jgi:hypothetical protein
MDQLQKQVARARRRLVLEQFLGRLVWCLLGALTIALAAVAVPRVFVLSNLPAYWDVAWLAGALGAGFLFALVWTLIRHRNAMDAAIEIDRRFDLRERVASSLSLRPEEQSSAAGRAVVLDALRAVKRIEVDEKFRVKLDRRAWWPLVPAAIAFVLVMFFDNREAASSLDPNSAASAQKQVKQSAEAVRKKIEERRKQAEKEGLKDAEGLFKKIEQGTRELEKQNSDRTKATVKMNDLIKQLEERREQIGGKDSLKQQFQNMKNLGAGPAEKVANAMKQGDWNKAMQEIKELEKQLRDGKLDANAKAKLAKQLEQMKEKLEAAAEARQQAMEDLKKQIEQARRAGNLSKAGELQEKLDRLQKQEQQMNRLQQLAQQMGQIQKQLQQGDDQKAAAAMAEMAKQLGQMQQQMKELEMLDATMDQLEMAKDALACEECEGEGCEGCMGSMANMEKFGANNFQSQMNNGMGGDPRAGAGMRPDERNATNTRETRVRQDPRQGPATFSGMVEGPNVTGDVAQEIKEEMATLSAEQADPLTMERLRGSRREHAEEYFRILREGK